MTDMLSNSAQRRAERREHRRFLANCLKAIVIMVILTIGAITLIRVNYILKVQTDMMDTLTQMETETLLVDELESDASRGDLRPTRSLGEFTITHYCACSICCGDSADGITATGTLVTEGRTIAVDPEVITLGSTVWISGHPYIAEDVGGAIDGNHIDIYVADHQDALQLGRQTKEVYQ